MKNNILYLSNLKIALEEFKKGKFDKAEKLLKNLYKEDKENLEVINLLLFLNYESLRIENAREFALISLQKNSKQPIVLNLKGLIHQNYKEYDKALSCFMSAIEVEKTFIDPYINAGNIFHETKKFTKALKIFDQALKINSKDKDLYFNKANALKELGNLKDAIKNYNLSLKENINFVSAYVNRASVFRAMGENDLALKDYETALNLRPSRKELLYEKIITLINLEKKEEAIQNFLQMQKELVDNVEKYQKIGDIYRRLNEFDKARDNLDIAFKINPNSIVTLQNISDLYIEKKKYNDAIDVLSKAISLCNNNHLLYAKRCTAYFFVGKYEEAISDNNKSLDLRNNSAEIYIYRGVIQENLGNIIDSKVSYEKAYKINKNNPDLLWNMSLAEIRKGNFEKGWALYENRWKTEIFKNNKKDFPFKNWDGSESLEGKNILLFHEQGYGDTIQFSRFAKIVKSMGALNVVMLVQNALVSTITTLSNDIIVCSSVDDSIKFDFCCPILSLPHRLKINVASIPYKSNYLYASKKKVEDWKKILGLKRHLRVGLCWFGSKLHQNDHHRSIPLNVFQQILIKDTQFISLQKELKEEELKLLGELCIIEDYKEKVIDFSDTAALIKNLDLVISVDTSVAHLAGALGKKVWLIIPACADYRWMEKTSKSPWYSSFKLFRQNERNNWNNVLSKITEDLKLISYDKTDNI